MASVGLSAGARLDYSEALQWYVDRSTVAAERFDACLDDLLREVAADPGRWPWYDSEHQFAIMRPHPYRLIFRHSGEQVTIIAIAHHSRNPNYWRG